MVKQEMARVNADILGIGELNWSGIDEFNSDDHYIYYCGQESLRRKGVALIVNKRVQNAVAAKLLQSCLTLCNPIDGSPQGSPIPGILQARTLEWVAIYGVIQSQTRLTRLSSSSSSRPVLSLVLKIRFD